MRHRFDDQDQLKETAIKWLLESSYAMIAVRSACHAAGHIMSHSTSWPGTGFAEISYRVRLFSPTSMMEAKCFMHLVEGFGAESVEFETALLDGGKGFSEYPEAVVFKLKVRLEVGALKGPYVGKWNCSGD